jgi:hypothetical protein
LCTAGRAGSIQAAINLEIDSPDVTHINVKVRQLLFFKFRFGSLFLNTLKKEAVNTALSLFYVVEKN